MIRRVYFPLLTIVLVVLASSCDKDNISPNPNIDWNGLENAVIEKDNSKVGQEISKLLIDTEPKPIDNDLIGQKFNIDNLIAEINKSGVLTAKLFCYACIETLPEQTEITITTKSSGVSVSRIIDISTPKDGVLEYVDIHDTD